MVEFTDSIKIPSKNRTNFEWIDADGRIIQQNVINLTDSELFQLRVSMNKWFDEQIAVIDAETNRWEPIYCAVCGQEDLAFRGRPFVTWGLRGNRILCPRHTMAFDRMGTPKGEALRQAKEEEREIKELFG